MNLKVFAAIGELAMGARRRANAEYTDFLSLYRQLVEGLPTEVVALFGRLQVNVTERGGKPPQPWGIELTVTDYMWWKQKIEIEGVRFVSSPSAVKCAMLNSLSRNAEAQRLSPEERKALLALLEEPAA